MADAPDDTVILATPLQAGAWRQWGRACAVAAIAASVIGCAIWLRHSLAPHPALRLADEATIAADRPTRLTVFRYAANPAVLVLDFPTLAEQGHMLNRLAAMAEKRGVPHDRLLDDATLATAIRASGDTAETWYYGHDYGAADIARFFALAESDSINLNPDERRLRALVHAAMRQQAGFGAVISLAAPDPAHGIDGSARAVILHHELSHGDYFTQTAYARYVGTVWRGALTGGERASIRRYLDADGYDPALEDVMVNEMQAYLFFTPDRRYFDPARSGFDAARLAQLRRQFAIGLQSPGMAAARPDGMAPDLSRLAASAAP